MSDNRGGEQGRDPSRPILEGERPGDAYEHENSILDELGGTDGDDLDDLDEDSADLEDFGELDDEDFDDEELDDGELDDGELDDEEF